MACCKRDYRLEQQSQQICLCLHSDLGHNAILCCPGHSNTGNLEQKTERPKQTRCFLCQNNFLIGHACNKQKLQFKSGMTTRLQICVSEVITIYQKQSRNQNIYSNHTKEQDSSVMLELTFRLVFHDEATYMVCKRKVGTSDGYTFLMLLTLKC